jgi:hypothetical protein
VTQFLADEFKVFRQSFMLEPKKDVIVAPDDLKEKDLENSGGEGVEDSEVAVDDAADKVISDGISPLLEGDEEETVTVKRGDLKKLHTNKENYKTVAIAAKKKPKETVVVAPKPEGEKPDEKFVTVESVRKNNEKIAIHAVTTVNSADDADTQALNKEINDNWDLIKTFYTGKSGKDDPEKIKEDILDAHAAWKRRYGSSAQKPKDKTAAELAASRGKGGSGGVVEVPGARKRILPQAKNPKETWYPSEDK